VPTPDRTPDDGRPSAEACARFALELHHELASSRLAWDAALLRSDEAFASGDQEAVDTAIDDHRLLLAALEDRVSAVLESATDGSRTGSPALGAAPSTPEEPAPTAPAVRPPLPAWRRGVASLLGAAAAVSLAAAVAVGTLPALDEASTTPAAATRTVHGPGPVDLRTAAVGTRDVERFSVADAVDPGRDLPSFSGALSPSAVAAPPVEEPASSLAAPAVEPPSTDGPADVPDRPAVPEAEELGAVEADADGATDVDATTVVPPLDEVGPRLPERDPAEVDVASSVPEPLLELTERVRRSLRSLPASDPTPGLR
jgi:hypothetical protein